MTLHIRHEGPKNNFVILPNEVFTNPKLTGNAVKLLGYLHVHVSIPGWQFRLEHMITVVAGESALRAARKCLRENGYLQESSTKGPNSTYKHVDMVFFSYPMDMSEENLLPEPVSSRCENYARFSTVENQVLNKTELKKLKEKELKKEQTPFDFFSTPSLEENLVGSHKQAFKPDLKKLQAQLEEDEDPWG